MTHRSGSVLIIVAGIAALLAALAVAFLSRMRADADETRDLLQQAQARMMRDAGLTYVLETARIGWDDPLTPEHEEAYGWVDIRDGLPGPRGRLGQPLFARVGDPARGEGPRFPAVGGAAARCPMRPMRLPPYALKLRVIYNPIPDDPTLSWAEAISGAEPDPQPQATDLAAFTRGDRTPAADATCPSWFRVYRSAPARFVVTCGSGGTFGFRSWQEVVDAGATGTFFSRAAWEDLRRAETVLWYEAEWNAAIARGTIYHYYNPVGQAYYRLLPLGTPRLSGGHYRIPDASAGPTNASALGPGLQDDHTCTRQFCGTFTYIERLADEPPAW